MIDTEFVKWTHLYSKLIRIVNDPASDYYGKFFILVKEGEAKYLTVEELYEFWKSNPGWVEQVFKPRRNERKK